jgi:hypothetical protein
MTVNDPPMARLNGKGPVPLTDGPLTHTLRPGSNIFGKHTESFMINEDGFALLVVYLRFLRGGKIVQCFHLICLDTLRSFSFGFAGIVSQYTISMYIWYKTTMPQTCEAQVQGPGQLP